MPLKDTACYDADGLACQRGIGCRPPKGCINIHMDGSLGMAIRARLVEARERSGLTQKQVAERLSKPLSPQSVSKWERGKGSPNPRELGELCVIYGVSSDWILKGIASHPDTGSAVVDRLLAKPSTQKKDSVLRGPAADRPDFEHSEK